MSYKSRSLLNSENDDYDGAENLKEDFFQLTSPKKSTSQNSHNNHVTSFFLNQNFTTQSEVSSQNQNGISGFSRNLEFSQKRNERDTNFMSQSIFGSQIPLFTQVMSNFNFQDPEDPYNTQLSFAPKENTKGNVAFFEFSQISNFCGDNNGDTEMLSQFEFETQKDLLASRSQNLRAIQLEKFQLQFETQEDFLAPRTSRHIEIPQSRFETQRELEISRNKKFKALQSSESQFELGTQKNFCSSSASLYQSNEMPQTGPSQFQFKTQNDHLVSRNNALQESQLNSSSKSRRNGNSEISQAEIFQHQCDTQREPHVFLAPLNRNYDISQARPSQFELKSPKALSSSRFKIDNQPFEFLSYNLHTQQNQFPYENFMEKQQHFMENDKNNVDVSSDDDKDFQELSNSKSSQYSSSLKNQYTRSIDEPMGKTSREINLSQGPLFSSIHSTQDVEIIEEISPIPSSITQLYQFVRSNYSDWSFVYALSAQICSDKLPMSSYVNLKISLLLSVISTSSSDSKTAPIPIVAIGENTGDANTIMHKVGNYAERFLRNFESGASINKKNWIEAGNLLLAKGGICFLGDWSGLKNQKCAQLIREVETGRVMVEKVFQTFPIECALWTVWSCIEKPKKDLVTLNQFVNVFGIPIVLEDSLDQDNLIDFILHEATGVEQDKPTELNISDEDMRTYLNIISKQTVSMSPNAEKMLRDYFLLTRINRPNALNQKSFQILKQMSESHAKLCFRDVVLSEDVLAAINISEKYIRVIFPETFESKSSPSSKLYDSFEDVESYMLSLKYWFSQFSVDLD